MISDGQAGGSNGIRHGGAIERLEAEPGPIDTLVGDSEVLMAFVGFLML